jgi:hypothetical protein
MIRMSKAIIKPFKVAPAIQFMGVLQKRKASIEAESHPRGIALKAGKEKRIIRKRTTRIGIRLRIAPEKVERDI